MGPLFLHKFYTVELPLMIKKKHKLNEKAEIKCLRWTFWAEAS